MEGLGSTFSLTISFPKSNLIPVNGSYDVVKNDPMIENLCLDKSLKTILVVEDDPINRQLIFKALELNNLPYDFSSTEKKH